MNDRYRRGNPHRQSPPRVLTRLRKIAAIRPQFANHKSTISLATTSAHLALQRVNAQAASVFLYDQLGRLARVALVGQDKDGRELDNSSLPPENHLPGESFTGKAVIPKGRSPFGEAQWSNTLYERRDIATRGPYTALLGDLRAAVSVPLNGAHRTFGVLEVVNKKQEVQGGFNVEDAHWLSLIGLELAFSLSNQRHLRQSEILHSLAEAIVSMFDTTTEEREVYRGVAESLTSPPLPYRVCIIRLKDDDLSTVAIAAPSDVCLSDRDDTPITSSHGLVGHVFQSGEYLYIPDIKKLNPTSYGLRNWDWAIKNKLESYACLPLLVEEEVAGTVSFYFGFRYTIDPDEKSFLETLARSLAAFRNGRRFLQELQTVTREDARDAATAEYDSELVPSRHDLRDYLLRLQEALKSLEGKNLGTTSGQQEYAKLYKMIADKYDKVKEEFLVAEPEAVDLNDLIRTVVQQKKKIPLDTYVDFHLHLDRNVPPITARTSALRYIVKDLIANAIKTIQRKNDGYGVIVVETRVAKEKNGQEKIELLVRDTGEGIPREQWGQIFNAGFSTYPGGTGLGLHLARSVLAASYGGTIEIESSTLGEGSTFRVSIPMWNRA